MLIFCAWVKEYSKVGDFCSFFAENMLKQADFDLFNIIYLENKRGDPPFSFFLFDACYLQVHWTKFGEIDKSHNFTGKLFVEKLVKNAILGVFYPFFNTQKVNIPCQTYIL